MHVKSGWTLLSYSYKPQTPPPVHLLAHANAERATLVMSTSAAFCPAHELQKHEQSSSIHPLPPPTYLLPPISYLPVSIRRRRVAATALATSRKRPRRPLGPSAWSLRRRDIHPRPSTLDRPLSSTHTFNRSRWTILPHISTSDTPSRSCKIDCPAATSGFNLPISTYAAS